MIIANLTMGDNRSTQVTGKSIEEVLEKIKQYHSMTDFEKQHFERKGTLDKELASGWYVTT